MAFAYIYNICIEFVFISMDLMIICMEFVFLTFLFRQICKERKKKNKNDSFLYLHLFWKYQKEK